MQAKARFCVALLMAVLVPAAVALAKPGGGGGGGGGKGGGGGGSMRSGGGSRSGGGGSNKSSGGSRSGGSMKINSGGNHSGSNHSGSSHSGGNHSGGSNVTKSGGLKVIKSGGGFSGGGGKVSGKPLGNLGGNAQVQEVGRFGNRLGSGGGASNFLKNNFGIGRGNRVGNNNHNTNTVHKNVTPIQRVNREVTKNLNKDNSFVKKHDIDGKKADNHWTRQDNSFAKNANFNGKHDNHNGNHHGDHHDHHHHNHKNFAWNPWIGWGLWGYGYTQPTWRRTNYISPCYGYNYYYTGNTVADAAPIYTADNQNGTPVTTETFAAASAAPPTDANPTLPGNAAEQEVSELDAASAAAFADQGEVDFKAGDYHAAVKDWQHSLVDDPKNGAVMMMLAQALFAKGKFEEAAGATQAAMQMLPEDKWGVVVSNYSQLYGNVQDYTDQLKKLEEARKSNPESPALRFLLGFQFGFLGYPKQAVGELDKALTIAPRDLGSRKLRETFAAKWPDAPPLPAAVLEASVQRSAGATAAPAAGVAPGPSGANPADRLGTP